MTGTEERGEAKEWRPGRTMVVLWCVLGTALSVVGIFAFAALYYLSRAEGAGRGIEVSVGVGDGLLVVALTLALLPTHELVHGFTMRLFDARPVYGFGAMGRVFAYLYCSAPGHLFTRNQFIAVTAAPLFSISLLGALWVAFLPLGGWLVVPLGVHLGGCVGDLWMLGLVLRQPTGTRVEDLKTGVRLYPPPSGQRS
jgi:hypothetical protein